MYSSAAEFITNQINPNSLWNFAETSVQYTQHLFGQYLSPTPAILGLLLDFTNFRILIKD